MGFIVIVQSNYNVLKIYFSILNISYDITSKLLATIGGKELLSPLSYILFGLTGLFLLLII